MQDKTRCRLSSADHARYEWLCHWLASESIIPYRKATTFQELCNSLLKSGLIEHVRLSRSESEPFIMGTTFYGPTIEAVIDAEREKLVAKGRHHPPERTRP